MSQVQWPPRSASPDPWTRAMQTVTASVTCKRHMGGRSDGTITHTQTLIRTHRFGTTALASSSRRVLLSQLRQLSSCRQPSTAEHGQGHLWRCKTFKFQPEHRSSRLLVLSASASCSESELCMPVTTTLISSGWWLVYTGTGSCVTTVLESQTSCRWTPTTTASATCKLQFASSLSG